jgi:hypothetical protein
MVTRDDAGDYGHFAALKILANFMSVDENRNRLDVSISF